MLRDVIKGVDYGTCCVLRSCLIFALLLVLTAVCGIGIRFHSIMYSLFSSLIVFTSHGWLLLVWLCLNVNKQEHAVAWDPC
jgi:hypothetical protein